MSTPLKDSEIDTIAAARVRTAMKDPEHMKRWLNASGRMFIVLKADDLIDALQWPAGVDVFMGVVNAYAQRRRTIPSGELAQREDPLTGEMVDITLYKDESLTHGELDRCIRYLVAKMYEIDPTWKLTDHAL